MRKVDCCICGEFFGACWPCSALTSREKSARVTSNSLGARKTLIQGLEVHSQKKDTLPADLDYFLRRLWRRRMWRQQIWWRRTAAATAAVIVAEAAVDVA